MERNLSEAQERRLNRKYCAGCFGGGNWSTIEALLRQGYLKIEPDRSLKLTDRAISYCKQYGPEMPI